MFAALGDAETDFGNDPVVQAGTDPTLNALRQAYSDFETLRATINSQINDVSNADVDMTDDDLNALLGNVEQMQVVAANVALAVQAWQQDPAYVANSATAAELNNWLAFAADWAGSTLAAAPAFIAQLPAATAGYVAGQMQSIIGSTVATLKSAEGGAISLAIPLVLGGVVLVGLLIFGTKQAETTRTGRALTRYV